MTKNDSKSNVKNIHRRHVDQKDFFRRDCFPPGTTPEIRDESRFDICRVAMLEQAVLLPADAPVEDVWKLFLGII